MTAFEVAACLMSASLSADVVSSVIICTCSFKPLRPYSSDDMNAVKAAVDLKNTKTALKSRAKQANKNYLEIIFI